MERSGSKTWQGQCVVFFGKALYSHSASLHSGVLMGIGKLLGNPDEILGGGGGEEWGPCDGLSSHSGESNDTAGRFIPSFIPTGISFSWGPLGLSADFILVK